MACFSSKTLVSIPSFLLLFPFSALVAQNTNGNSIPLGASLTAIDNSSPWLSPSRHFAFGFRKLTSSDHLFLLCIWFAKLPDKTIVWFARPEDHSSPAAIPRGSNLTVTSGQGLLLTEPRGQQAWKTTFLPGAVSSAAMTDTGNFLLRDRSSNALWQSFDSPTDTLLPWQSLEPGGSLSSWRYGTNFSRVKFELRLLEDGDLVLNSVNLPSDYSNDGYFSIANVSKLVFNESGLYGLREDGGGVMSTTTGYDSTQYYLRATLEFDGVFVVKSGSGGWAALWSRPHDICLSQVESSVGVCGFNNICRLKDNDTRPYCQCPPGFSLLNPSDTYGDCKSDFVNGCEADGNIDGLYDIEELNKINWPLSDSAVLSPTTADSCKESCLNDCFCSVAIYVNPYCWKKKLPLSYGRVVTFDCKAFIKVRKAQYSTFISNGTKPVLAVKIVKEKDRESLILAVSVLLGTSAIVNVLLLAFFLYRKKKDLLPIQKNDATEISLRCFAYKELEAATDGFSEELGRGAFGMVFKGTLKTAPGTAIAVKKLYYVAPETVKEFTNEATIICQTHHKNLVRLLGYCDDGTNRLLVYEYMSNGTLASHIFGDVKPSWKQRMETALGIAKGLLYLHEECATQIIHCDIKPQNILLDEYRNPKISDFGLAKLLRMEQSRTNTAIRGTKGYVAPEWFRNVPVTAKADVYSFGVVLLEMICCRRSVESENAGQEILTDWAYDCFSEGALDVLVGWEAEAMEEREKVERSVRVSLWCIQENPSLRPTLREVVQMLEGVVQVQVPPCPFPYST